jgi:ABC-type Fe3+-siderophore transport system permease subunit
MMLMDILSKSGVILDSVIPVGVLTSLLGAPFFIHHEEKENGVLVRS